MSEPVKKIQTDPAYWVSQEWLDEVNFWRHDPYGDECASYDDDDSDDDDGGDDEICE
jgi:hypothetical protein